MLEMIGHKEAYAKLQTSFLRDKLSHAYLLNGPDGCGKTLFSKIVASLVNCENNLGEAKEDSFCGECASCIKIENDNHPDFTLISPEKSTIKIDQIRDMQKSIYRKANEGRYKVYVIEQADKMTEEAQNSLLKILEEPLGQTIIFLTAENKDRLLPTIISRCNVVNLTAPGEAEVTKWLMTMKVDAKEAKKIALISEGLPGKAMEIRDSEKYFKLRKYIVDKIFDVVTVKTSSSAIKSSELLINRLKKDAEDESLILSELAKPEETMDFIADVFSDVMKYNVTGDDKFVRNIDQISNIQKIASSIGVKECANIARGASHTAEKIRARANVRMAFDDFLLSIV